MFRSFSERAMLCLVRFIGTAFCFTVQMVGIGLAFEKSSSRLNIVFIVADDLGYGELGCYGGSEIPTPNIDSLAVSGVRFTNGYVTAPFCAASRAALMTGRYATRFGFEFNPIGAQNALPGIGLPTSERTIADRLREQGYATALIGKWHLGGTAPYHPERRGFDQFFGFLHEGHYYVPHPWSGTTTWLRRTRLPDGSQGRWTSPDGRTIWSTHMNSREPDYDADNPILQSSQPIQVSESLTDLFTRRACDFMERHRSQPFFVYLAYNAVHSPMQALDVYISKCSHINDMHRRIFAAMLMQLDDSVGTVLAKLQALGLDENTLVVFLSDNGGPTKELTSSNRPLRGGKGELFEGGIRVPFLVSWKGSIAPQTVHTPAFSMDATATAIELAGGLDTLTSGSTPLDGRSLLPLLRGQSHFDARRPMYWRVGKKQAIRQENWKLIRHDGAWQLFDLANDLSEQNDVASGNREIVLRLEESYRIWDAGQAKPLW